jgi:hypothetical protein
MASTKTTAFGPLEAAESFFDTYRAAARIAAEMRERFHEITINETGCPNCGDFGGDPVEVRNEDLSVGYSTHDLCCTLCAPKGSR